MIEAVTMNAISMILLLRAIEAMYPGKRLIHLFVHNAHYHPAKLVHAWLGGRIKLHFIPTYLPTSRCDRAPLGPDAQARHPPPM